MRQNKKQNNTFYESLSDITMATLGIFIIFFVINILFVNKDVIEMSAENNKLENQISELQTTLEDMQYSDLEKIKLFKENNDKEIKIIEEQITKTRELSNQYNQQIENSRNRIKEELNADELISVEEIRKILQQVKLKREKVENQLNTIKMKSNNVRQEFNEYVEVENSYPYLELDISGNYITLDNVKISEKQFRAILGGINAGSGFTYRMKKKWNDGKYIRPKAPDWLNEILVTEGWFPIIDID